MRLLALLPAAYLASVLAWAQIPKATIAYGCAPEDLEMAGQTCTATHPCAVYLELSSIEVVGGKLFLSGNLHTSDSTLMAILLSSDDRGRTWSEPYKRIPGAGIEQIQFIDYQNGWISGQTILGRPRDAFVLITHDGGKTWTSRPVFEESRIGIVQQFWFETKDTGSLLIDRMQPTETGSRYELYESHTGGESWTLLEVSARQLKIKRSRAAEANPDWRLRADAATKTYQLEQRQAEKWRAVTVFPIQVAECKGVELQLAEPLPETEEPKPAAAPTPALKKRKKT